MNNASNFLKILVVFFVLITSQSVWAEKSLHAHEHGHVKLGIAVEKNTVTFDLDTPAESLLSFENTPKTKEEKEIFAKVENEWKKVFELIIFKVEWNCKVVKSEFFHKLMKETVDHKADHKEEGVHSEIEATAQVSCNIDLKGQEIQVALRKKYQNIRQLTIDVISEKSFSIKGNRSIETIRL